MYKKLFSSVFLAVSLMFFVSCQQQNDKKDNKQPDTSYQKNGRKGTYHRGKQSSSPSMPVKTCPKDKPCPSEQKKTCPGGCKKKCCINESDNDEAVLQEKQEIISLHDLTNNDLPLEELKAAIENNTLNID